MNIKIDTFTSVDGNDISVHLGFTPGYIKILNQTRFTGGGLGEIGIEWFGPTMGDTNEMRITTIADDQLSSVVNLSYTTSGWTTSTTGSKPSVSGEFIVFSGSEGFTLDQLFLSPGDVIWYMAVE